MTNPINWFEIPVNDLNRAKNFYEKTFGFKLSLNEMGPIKMAWFPMEPNATGATGSLIKAEGHEPTEIGSMVYFSVDDIEKILQNAAENGGSIVNPKSSIGEFGFVGHFLDSEGNRIGLHSHK